MIARDANELKLNDAKRFQTEPAVTSLKSCGWLFYLQKEATEMSIQDRRAEIDAIDAELLRLLNMRARLAVKVGETKRAAGLSLCDPVREREVIRRVCGANSGPLDEQAVTRLFRCIIRESRLVEASVMEQAGNQQEV
jgi:chorismate mutase-like protein